MLTLCPLLQKIDCIISTWGRHHRWICLLIFSADKWEHTPLHTLCSSVTQVRQVVLDSQRVCPLHSSMCWHPPLPYFRRLRTSIADGLWCSTKLNAPLQSSTVGKHTFTLPPLNSRSQYWERVTYTTEYFVLLLKYWWTKNYGQVVSSFSDQKCQTLTCSSHSNVKICWFLSLIL